MDGSATSSAGPPPLPRAIQPLSPFQPDLYQRGWSSTPHPTLPLLATAHNKSVTIFSLVDFTAHSSLTGGHSRSVRSTTWRPGLSPHKLCLVTGSFDSTAGLWRWEQNTPLGGGGALESEVSGRGGSGDSDEEDDRDDGWEFTLVLEGQEHEIKSVAFSPSGQYLATCSRDKSVWIWEDVGGSEDDDEWETVAVLNEHEGDVKCVAWCPDVPGRRSGSGSSQRYGLDVLASTSYDNTIRLWREDGDGEWVCVAVLEGHESTVWGVQWEASATRRGFPRLLSWSADQTLRVWTMQGADEEGDDTEAAGEAGAQHFHSRLGGVPNTMRQSLHEEWSCTAVLPRAHTRDIYSATWSATTGLVASTGSDGIIAVYAEDQDSAAVADVSEAEAAAELDGDLTNGHSQHAPAAGKPWRVLMTVPNAHGPYEINNVTWCRRFDAGARPGGTEEMLVSTGDDGIVRPWQLVT